MQRTATFLWHPAAAATLAIASALFLSAPSPARAVDPADPGAPAATAATAAPAEAAPAEEAVPGAAKHRIVISLKDRRLTLWEDGAAVRSYPVAIGRPGVAIPLGDSRVVRKRRNPTWHPTANQRRAKPSLPLSVPPGPSNPLGRHALDLGWSAIAIHGTNEPGSIGRRASSGCFRMLPADVEALFAVVEVGTPVRVVAEGMDPPVAVRAASKPPAAARPIPAPVPASPPPAPPRRAVTPASLRNEAPPAAARAAARAAAPVEAPVEARVEAPIQIIPDPRCATAAAPLRRMICTLPDLAALDGRTRGMQDLFLSALPADRRDAAAYALVRDERSFDERIAAQCWIRRGAEADPAQAAAARSCLHAALTGRMAEVRRRIAELGGERSDEQPGGARMAVLP